MMVPVIVFFGIAAAVGCVIHAAVRIRARAVVRRSDTSEADRCQIRRASRISSLAIAASLIGLVAVGLAYLVLRSS